MRTATKQTRSWRTTPLLLVLLVCACASSVFGQATQPTSATGFESRPIRRAVDAGASSSSAGAATPASTGGELARMLASLGIVLAIICLLWWVGRQYFNPKGNFLKARGVRVLSRQPIAPRQQVMLLQVGAGRIIVVADSSGTLTTLANIDDPDEVAQLVGATQPMSASPVASDERDLENATPQEFEAALGAQQSRFQSDDAGSVAGPDNAPESESAVRSEVSSLLDKVRSLRSQMQRQ